MFLVRRLSRIYSKFEDDRISGKILEPENQQNLYYRSNFCWPQLEAFFGNQNSAVYGGQNL